MRTSILVKFAVLALLGSGLSLHAGAPFVRVFVLSGQSNMGGGNLPQALTGAATDVWYDNSTGVDVPVKLVGDLVPVVVRKCRDQGPDLISGFGPKSIVITTSVLDPQICLIGRRIHAADKVAGCGRIDCLIRAQVDAIIRVVASQHRQQTMIGGVGGLHPERDGEVLCGQKYTLSA
jgi:hypothetical protein